MSDILLEIPATELRLGNYVVEKGIDYNTEGDKKHDSDSDLIVVVDVPTKKRIDEEGFIGDMYSFHPLPLTPYLAERSIEMDPNRPTIFKYRIPGKEIILDHEVNYVHELQNAYYRKFTEPLPLVI